MPPRLLDFVFFVSFVALIFVVSDQAANPNLPNTNSQRIRLGGSWELEVGN